MKFLLMLTSLILSIFFSSSIAFAEDGYKSAFSLCHNSEKVLITCQVKLKTVSICIDEENKSKRNIVYRYGKKDHVEVETNNLYQAFQGFVAGGETQVSAETPTRTYIVYDRMIRIAVDKENHNISSFTQGLLILGKNRKPWIHLCREPMDVEQPVFSEPVDKLLPEGKFVDHRD